MTPTKLILTIVASVWFSTSLPAAESIKPIDLSKLPPPATKLGITFATDIMPIFERSCVRCHGAEKPKARLRLDTLEGALRGGESGKVIQAGKSAESKLIQSIAHLGDEDYFMPPPGNKAGIQRLTTSQIGLVRAWVDQGAK